jgi:RNA polymerase subunit RPABC4/transcription elongation factor Spt4
MICPHCKEPIHPGFSVCPICKTPLNVQQLQPKVIPQTYQQPTQKVRSNLVEYRRTCQVCGKVWHSLVSREKQIISNQKSNQMLACGGAMQSCGTCGSLGSGTQAQGTRNVEANQSELQRLKICPQCSSANYREEIVNHAS